MKYKVTAVIPVMQYGNIQPEIEVEAATFDEANRQAMGYIEQVWAQYGEKPLPTKTVTSGSRKLVECFVGGEIYYDDLTHTYTNEAGDVYLSGSQFAKQFEKPFDGQAIAGKMASKYQVNAHDIREMWELKARTSREFGTALHSALQLYGQYNGLATALERETHLHDHPVIKSAVQGFYKDHDEQAEYEIFVVDHKTKHVGQIDRLVILGEKECRVEDFKTNAELDKAKVAVYWKQLDFYGDIMKAAGWKVHPPKLHHFNGSWTTLTKGEL